MPGALLAVAVSFTAEGTQEGVVMKINGQEWAKGVNSGLFQREPLNLIKPESEFVLGARGGFDIVRDKPYYQFSIAVGMDLSTFRFYSDKTSFFYPSKIDLGGDITVTDLLIL